MEVEKNENNETTTTTTMNSSEEETTLTTSTEDPIETTTSSFYNQIEEIVEQDENVYLASVEENLHLQNDTSVLLTTDLNSSNETHAETDGDGGGDGNNDDFAIPLRIILPVEHVHHDPIKDSYMKYNYIVLNTNDENVHDHVGEHESVQRIEDVTEYTQRHDLLNEIGNSGTELFVNKAGQIYQLLKEYQLTALDSAIEFKEVSLLETDIVRDKPTITHINQSMNLRKHYDQLIQWLTWQFEPTI